MNFDQIFRVYGPAIDRLDAKHLHTREDAPGTSDPHVRFDVELLNLAKTRLWKGEGSAPMLQGLLCRNHTGSFLL